MIPGCRPGWTKAVRYALTENLVHGNANSTLPEYFRRAESGLLWDKVPDDPPNSSLG